MEKMKFETPNLTNKNIDKIAELFPNVITEVADENGNIKKAVNFDMLRQLLSGDIAEGDEAYEFTWVGKKSAIAEANKPIRKTLRPCPEESVNWDTTENLYIEGDNLEVLKLLQESYLGKVKMIYIDPPYNTGNDFIYRDDFNMSAEEYSEEIGEYDEDGNRLFKNTNSNGRFHSDWCSMIYSRLLLARNLLSADGVIFISIDDNEVDNLRKICDEVFGEGQFEADFIIKVRHEKRILRDDIRYQSCIEHILCYSNSQYTPNRLKKENNEEDYCWNIEILSSPRKIIEVGGYKIEVYDEKSWKAEKTDNGQFKEYQIRGSLITQKGSASEFYELYLRDLRDEDGCGTLYKVIGMGENGDGLGYRYIRHPYDLSFKNGFYYQGKPLKSSENKGLPYPNYYDFVVESNNVGEEGGVEYKGGKKPVALIKKMIEISGINNHDAPLVMDFFSGSATLAHAIMENNALFCSKVKYILIQLPEDLDETCQRSSPKNKASIKNLIKFLDSIGAPHYLTEIGKERIRRAAKKIAEENPDVKFDGGFRVLKTDESNMRDVYYSPAEYDQTMLDDMESNIKPDRTSLDLLFGCLLDWGLPLSMPYFSEEIEGVTVHTYNGGDLIACFDENIPESVITALAKRKPLRAVFRDSSFADSPAKINVFEIFKLYAPETRVKVI